MEAFSSKVKIAFSLQLLATNIICKFNLVFKTNEKLAF